MRYILIVLLLSMVATAYAEPGRKDGWSTRDKEQDVVMGGD